MRVPAGEGGDPFPRLSSPGAGGGTWGSGPQGWGSAAERHQLWREFLLLQLTISWRDGQQVCGEFGNFSAAKTSLALPHRVEEREGVSLLQEGRRRAKGERAGTWGDGSWRATKIPS